MSALFEGRIALVTGASRGIGRAVALELARAGAHVLALARTQGTLEALDDDIRRDGGKATLVPCDLQDFEALDRLGAEIFKRWSRLDIFIGNAGVRAPLTPLAHVDPKQWEEVLAVNVTSNWRLIRSLDPLLRSSDAGRVVFLTGRGGADSQATAYWGLYTVSKAALEALMMSYAAETRNISSVRVMAVDPGPVRTNLRAALMPGEDPMSLPSPDTIAPKILALCLPQWTLTGMVYQFSTDRVLNVQLPA